MIYKDAARILKADNVYHKKMRNERYSKERSGAINKAMQIQKGHRCIELERKGYTWDSQQSRQACIYTKASGKSTHDTTDVLITVETDICSSAPVLRTNNHMRHASRKSMLLKSRRT